MSSEFNFFQHWYPVMPVEDIRPDYPIAVIVLGINLVIWKPHHSPDYKVFLDQCPHRLAPLSEGRIDEQTGLLMCSYHGWQFDPQGQCQSIPQAKSDFCLEDRAELCATVFPCQVANELLWVWPDADSSKLADQTKLPLSPQIDADQGFVWDNYVRDLEYDWQTLVENVVDPSHVPFAHHGLQGKREQAAPLPIEITCSTPELIKATTKARFKADMVFEPPCRVEYAIALGNSGKQVGLVTYCIPTVPGKCRIVAQFPRNFAQTLHKITPRWWSHVKTRNAVLDGDMILLQQQEQLFQKQIKDQSWKTAYKLPTSADRFVIEFRKWFDHYCHGKLPWPIELTTSAKDGKDPVCDRKQVLNRYHQHTQHCQSCRTALKSIQRIEWSLASACVLALAITALMPDEHRLSFGFPVILLGISALGLGAWLKYKLEPEFYFVDYIHAERK